MGDPESSAGDTSPLSPLKSAERDADGNFGFDELGTIVSPCASAAAPAMLSRVAPAASHQSSTTVSPNKKHWVEIVMVDQEGIPVPGQTYEIRVPDGTVVLGSTDAKGRGRVDGIDAGDCKITFPQLDKDVWKKK
jgi:hypothetical protein